MSPVLRTVERTALPCPVCGCSEVRSDEVLDTAWLWLGECPRCDHRWTRRSEPPSRALRALPAVPERAIASAA
jgi:hypothetical protein